MMVHPFPKKHYKKQKIKHEPPLFPQGFCYRCYWLYGIKRTAGLDKHHIFGAANRPLSEQYGLYVPLCNEFQPEQCHLKVTNEKDREFITHLKQEGQRRFEERHTRQEFKEIFGRNYL
jgi:hypothetical protein